MSSEILVKKFIFEKDEPIDFEEYNNANNMTPPPPLSQTKEDEPVHSSVHDLEGFFWVLVWLYLSRDSPAQRYHGLLPDNKDPQQRLLRIAFTSLFEGSDSVLAFAKHQVFTMRSEFSKDVLRHISTYCNPLRSLLGQFYEALRGAHQRHSFEGLYDKVVSAFTAAEKKVAQLPTTSFTTKYHELEKAEEERRHWDVKGHRDVHLPPTKGTMKTVGNPEQWDPVSPTPPAKCLKGVSWLSQKVTGILSIDFEYIPYQPRYW